MELFPNFSRVVAVLALASLAACTQTESGIADRRNKVIVSIKDQRLTVVKADQTRETFAISTSRFGLGDRPRSYATPLGKLEVAGKIGAGAEPGTVFHGRMRTGEIVQADAPGRDPIVTRILRLRGLEEQNSRAEPRGIYIHGTPDESHIGVPASYGCIRMKSRDVIRLFSIVGIGSTVTILDAPLSTAVAQVVPPPAPPAAPVQPGPAGVPAAEAKPAAPQLPSSEVLPTVVASAPSAAKAKGAKGWAGDPERLLAGQSGVSAVRPRAARRGAGDDY